LEFLLTAVDFFVHLDVYIGVILEKFGLWTYLLLFLTIFCETGLVVTPFLPGDSLIFVVGAFAAAGKLDVGWLFVLLVVASVGGNTLNYQIGSWFGPAVFEKNYRFLKRKYLDQTHEFFEKYGAKTIIFARFLPIVRTFAPFLAGVGRMTYLRFTIYNVVGSLAWVTLFLYGGFFFGEIPIVKRNLTLVIFAILLISVVPTVFEVIRRRFQAGRMEKKDS